VKNPDQHKTLTADSYPYVTGMGFRQRAHLIWDEFQKDDPCVINRDGQTAFVKTDLIKDFFLHAIPKMGNQINIITHNSALGINLSHLQYLNNIKVINWYAQNANIAHEKLISIPLGIANRRWPHGNIKQLESVMRESTEKDHLIYMNFDVKTNLGERSKVYDHFRDKEYVHFGSKKPFLEYLKDLKGSRFSLSPQGRGTDCHRIWESILMGTIPIVKECQNISFYREMPITIIKNWEDVSESFLRAEYKKITSRGWDHSKLFLDYWINRVGLKNE